MNRTRRTILVVLAIYPAWLAMMALHEIGHVIHVRLSGGTVNRVIIPLAGFSRTDLATNPRPQFVAWGGALWGCLIPVLLLLFAHGAGRAVYLARLFAGFCLIANGAYIGLGPLMTAGDGHDLIRHGASAGLLYVVGSFAVAVGLYLWHRAPPKAA